MKRFGLPLLIPAIAMLAACGDRETVEPDQAAADFAARINGGEAPAPQQPVAQDGSQQLEPPQMVEPRPIPPPEAIPLAGAAPGSGPISPNCKADRMGPFLGRPADEATRLAVMNAAAGASDVRFIDAGSDFIAPDPANPRLNIMLDARGIIRDAKCG